MPHPIHANYTNMRPDLKVDSPSPPGAIQSWSSAHPSKSFYDVKRDFFLTF